LIGSASASRFSYPFSGLSGALVGKSFNAWRGQLSISNREIERASRNIPRFVLDASMQLA
jgi:hypothetical protein